MGEAAGNAENCQTTVSGRLTPTRHGRAAADGALLCSPIGCNSPASHIDYGVFVFAGLVNIAFVPTFPLVIDAWHKRGHHALH
jgi:hypothetical protein